MTGDDDRLTTAIGIALVVFIVAAIAVIVLAGISAPSRQEPEPPDVEWTVERANDTYVWIVHDGGGPIAGSELAVSVDGVERPVLWEGRVTQGDAGLVLATPGQTVRLYWISGRDDRILLEEWEV